MCFASSDKDQGSAGTDGGYRVNDFKGKSNKLPTDAIRKPQRPCKHLLAFNTTVGT
jgi:hypothetical protein